MIQRRNLKEKGMRLRTGKPEDVGVSTDRVNKIRKNAKGWVDEGIHPSLVILAARHGVIFLHEALGVLGTEDPSCPIELNTIFPLASISKLFTGTAAMILVEEGLLGLNRPVADYLPEFAGEEKAGVMVRHLMTHTSGIRDEQVYEQIRNEGIEWEDPFPLNWLTENIDQYIALICDTSLHNPPNQEMYYADANFDLLGEIVGRIAGTGITEFAEKRIFSPLGMRDTTVMVPDDLRERVVKRPQSAPYYDKALHAMNIPLGSGGAFSTAMDMAIFSQMFLNGGVYGEARILSPTSVHAMTRNQIPGIGAHFLDEYFPEANWGLGWSVHQNGKSWAYGEIQQSQRSFCHGGAGGVFLWVDPVYEVVAVFFSVVLGLGEYGHPKACTDLFINAVLSSIIEL
jgi:CubicO group peptidase (beta-lactamase class C family)